jgi:hypothetical protein
VAIGIVASPANFAAANSVTVTLSSVLAGDTVVAFVHTFSGVGSQSVSDGVNPGNYPQKLFSNFFAGFPAGVYVLDVSLAGTNVIVTALSDVGTSASMVVYQLRGAGGWDQGSINAGTAATLDSGSTAALVGGSELALGFYTVHSTAGPVSGGNIGGTAATTDNLNVPAVGTAGQVGSEHQFLAGVTGVVNATFGDAQADNFYAAIAVVRAAATPYQQPFPRLSGLQ